MRRFAFFALAVILAWPASAQVASEDGRYRIRPGDTLQISVLEDPNLGRQVLVGPDGFISLPIAGSVMAEGVTPERLESVLQQRFSRGFEITPTVTVSLRFLAPGLEDGEAVPEEDATVFYLLGAIGRRGPLAVTEPTTILEALAIAGGPTPFAASDRIQIRRFDEEGRETIILFDYERIEDGDEVVGNIVLEDGDIIMVPERGLFN